MTAAKTIDRDAIRDLVIQLEEPITDAKRLAYTIRMVGLDPNLPKPEREAIHATASICHERCEAIDDLWRRLADLTGD